jgi:hypothetical protein
MGTPELTEAQAGIVGQFNDLSFEHPKLTFARERLQLLRSLQVDFELVLRRPIETARITGQVGIGVYASKARQCPNLYRFANECNRILSE